MKPESKKYSTTVGNQTLTFETGKLAGQAGGAVTFGTTKPIVFAGATMGGVREGIDFFPLSVEYEERLYAGGKIPGSFFRREGRAWTECNPDRPSHRPSPAPALPGWHAQRSAGHHVLAFSRWRQPAGYPGHQRRLCRDDDLRHPLGRTGGAVRVGRVNGEFVINPTFA